MEKDEVEYKIKDSTKEYYQEYREYLDKLFARARDTNGLQYIYTLLRVSGIQDGGWDPFVEAQEALVDFSKILQKISKKGLNKSSFRLALLIYCHSVEMSAPYQILFNLLQCAQGKNYVPFPFPGEPLGKKKPFSFRPQSPTKKITTLKQEAEKIGEQELINKISSFFDDEIRNAFYHSDYSLTDTEFRICENGIPNAISFEILSEKLARCFAFYQAFFDLYKLIRLSFRKTKKFHRMPNYEVFELLTDRKEGLIGFKMHFSNGSKAFFERRKERVHGINVMLEKDYINFFVGELAKLQRKWVVNDKIFREKNTRYNSPCVWRPILFYGKSDEVITEVKNESKDKDVQGCLFYMKCTGHESIEFAVKSNKLLFEGKEFKSGKIEATLCDCSTDKIFVYDCTYFVNSDKAREIKKGINRIEKFVNEFKNKGFDIVYTLKYHLERKMKPPKDNDGRGFTITFSMDDPRNTLCLSNFGILPKTDWKIKPDWIE